MLRRGVGAALFCKYKTRVVVTVFGPMLNIFFSSVRTVLFIIIHTTLLTPVKLIVDFWVVDSVQNRP